MRIRPPHFANTLLFRISATFLLLMSVCLGGYYLWIEKAVFNPFADETEKEWYEDLADQEMGDLAAQAAELADHPPDLAAVMQQYGERARHFKAEVILFDATGVHLLSTAPDSLPLAVPAVDADLLARMSRDDWDFGSYPVPGSADANENRIFIVETVRSGEDQPPTGYLVASFFPVSIISDDLNADSRMLETQENIFKVLMGMLIYSGVTALLIMAWTGRRVQRLSAGVETFANGDLGHRVRVRSNDEIGTLGSNFNRMAERIELMVEKTRQKEQFQRQLIANVSHDLRTPLASMRGYVETLLMGFEQVERSEQERYLRIIAGNLDHLDRLVEHTLVLSRFDSGQAVFRHEEFPLGELADSVIVRLESLAQRQQITLDLEVGADVGLVRADPLQIGQVLQNLVENGIKFGRQGGRVTVALTRQGERVLIEVCDDGIGIQPEDLPQVFDRFFTADRSRTRRLEDPQAPSELLDPVDSLLGAHLGQSSGLGLAIASKIVAGHGSELTVRSEPGAGSVFGFHLAAVRADDQARSADA